MLPFIVVPLPYVAIVSLSSHFYPKYAVLLRLFPYYPLYLIYYYYYYYYYRI
jgi:hypothetical protein